MVAPAVIAGSAIAIGVPVLSVMAKAIQGLYGMTVAINDYLDKHIEEMKGSDNPTVSRTGRVIEMAKFGFGLGYITSVIVIATGQLLLGNPLLAVGTVVTAATLTNPIAMTCAAVGAIYYGWGALSDVEREEILEKLGKGLAIGGELIKSVVQFVIDTTKALLSSKNLDEMKKYIASAAETFGRSLSDVTHKLSDVVSEGLDTVKEMAGKGFDKTGNIVSGAYTSAKEAADGVVEKIKKTKRADVQFIDVQPEPPKALPPGTEVKSALLTPRKPNGGTRRK